MDAADRQRGAEDEEEEEERRRRTRTAHIKSENPHLTGGEIQDEMKIALILSCYC